MGAAERWLVDGWNLLHGMRGRDRAGRSSKPTPDDILSLLAGLAAETGCRVLVIWDGHGPGGRPDLKAPVSSSVENIYSADQTADSVLERYLFEHRSEAAFCVVSDDSAMGRIARGCGARVFSIARFRELLDEQRKKRDERSQEARADDHGFNRPFGKLL